MPKIRFTSAAATGIVLAKIGNPQRNEPLQTSQAVFRVAEGDREPLTALFLRPFRNLAGHRFSHHSSLDQHELNTCARAIFATADGLLEKGCDIAKRLYSKSNHPAIKSGDLCIALIENIEVNGAPVRGLCILKSETVVPFLSISTHDGDLQLSTEQGINPEKIDKGCLILDHLPNKGYYVLTFDRSGSESRFWVRDFLGVVPVTDAAFLTNKYADMAVAFIEKETKEQAGDDSAPWEGKVAARDALAYFDGKEKFSLQEFEEQVLKSPAQAAKFAQHRKGVEDEQGQAFDDSFDISKKDITKVRRRLASVVKLDTGVEIHLNATTEPEQVIERGFDPEKGMKFIKVFFNKEK
jgi:hypothetical protein